MKFTFSDPNYDDDRKSHYIIAKEECDRSDITRILNSSIGMFRVTLLHLASLEEGYMLIISFFGIFSVRYDFTYSQFCIYGPRKALARMSQSK
jgi:hypothetical protein